MSTSSEKQEQKVTYDNIISFIREHEDPCVTASEIASEFDMTNQGANYRLDQLKKRGEVEEKVAGASAKVWYALG